MEPNRDRGRSFGREANIKINLRSWRGWQNFMLRFRYLYFAIFLKRVLEYRSGAAKSEGSPFHISVQCHWFAYIALAYQ